MQRPGRSGHSGAKYLGKPFEFVEVARRDALDKFARARRQVDFDAARIDRAAPFRHEALGFATLDQGDGSLVACVEARRQLADRRPLASAKTAQMKQKQVLQQRNTAVQRLLPAETLELRQAEAQLGQGRVFLLAYQDTIAFGCIRINIQWRDIFDNGPLAPASCPIPRLDSAQRPVAMQRTSSSRGSVIPSVDREAIERAAEERHRRRARLPAVLDYAFRPMFLAAAGWAVIALALWLAMYFGYLQLPTRFDPMAWHVHEMLFGFVMAAVAGFLLSAIPNWTRRLPVRGYGLGALAVLWLLGRVACLISAQLPPWLAIVVDVAFPGALLVVAAREIIAGRNWRNVPMTAPLALFIAADVLMHLEALGWAVPTGLGWRLALAAPILLVSVIGGRMIPVFTRNWLVKRKSARLPSPSGRLDTAAIGVLAAALILWALAPTWRTTAALLILAALANAARLSRWKGLATWGEPLLFILHVGYGWLVAGVLLLGLSILDVGVPIPSAIHALTTGAIAVMILAVMPRVSLGHTGRELTTNRATAAVFVLINIAAITRVCASWHTRFATALLIVAGLCWIAAFGLFAIAYGPMLLTRRR